MIIGNPKEQKKEAINFREMSPDSSSPEMFTGSFVEVQYVIISLVSLNFYQL